jgi:hypothetical protein
MSEIIIIEKENRQYETFHIQSLNISCDNNSSRFISFSFYFELSPLDFITFSKLFEFPKYCIKLNGIIVSDDKLIDLKGILISSVENYHDWQNKLVKVHVICDYCSENKDSNLAKSLRRNKKLELLGI